MDTTRGQRMEGAREIMWIVSHLLFSLPIVSQNTSRLHVQLIVQDIWCMEELAASDWQTFITFGSWVGLFYRLEEFCIVLERATSVCLKMSRRSFWSVGELLCDHRRQGQEAVMLEGLVCEQWMSGSHWFPFPLQKQRAWRVPPLCQLTILLWACWPLSHTSHRSWGTICACQGRMGALPGTRVLPGVVQSGDPLPLQPLLTISRPRCHGEWPTFIRHASTFQG